MRMSTNIRKLLLLFLMALILAGCTNAEDLSVTTAPTVPAETEPPVPQITYTISSKSFAEMYGEYYDRKRSFTADYNGITYHFDVAVEEEERLDVILESDALVSVLLESHPDYSPELTLCFRPGDYPPRVLDHTLYIGLDHLRTHQYAVGMAVAVFGHDINYGILYAHGTQAAEKMGYPVQKNETELTDALSLYDIAPEYLDLNYPCFLEEYANPETLPLVQKLAEGFYSYLSENQLLDLLTDYSDEAYCAYLSEFLTANGKGEYDNSDLGNTIFYFGGPKIRLIWENEDAVYYIEDEFKTQYDIPGWEDRINSGYANLRQLVVDYQLQADFMEQRLGKYELEDGRVDVLFTAGHSTDRYSIANYTHGENLIRMFCPEPFLHEYGHYLLRDTGIDSWMNELICYYYCYNPVDAATTYMWDSEVARIEALGSSGQTGAEHDFVQMLLRRLGHEINWSEPEDFEYVFSGYLAVYNDYASLLNPDAGAEAKYSFLSYLIDIAGEEAVIDSIVINDPITVFGKSWETLIADWEAAVREEYSWIGRYFYVNGGT